MEKVGDLLREKILIVDNARYDRAVTADILAQVGYATIQVENGTRALEMVQVESPDLVILDSLTPDLDGLEICRHLKSDSFTNHIPILIFTPSTSVPDKVSSLRTGADAYLTRPVTPEEIIAQVEALLRRSFHFDPLTKLPAAPYLHRQIDARLAQNQPTAVLYLDIDHFRPYNQAYGHDAGDRVLVATAKLIVESLPSGGSFAGHLGSDDFMAVLPPDGADTLAQTLLARFVALQKEFYNDSDFGRRSIGLENRRGENVEYPLMSVSVALVTNERRSLINYVQVSELLAEVMGYCKSQGGGKWARDRRTH